MMSLTLAQFETLLLAILALAVLVGLLVHAVRKKSVFGPYWERYTLRDNPFSFWVVVIVYAVMIVTGLMVLINPGLLSKSSKPMDNLKRIHGIQLPPSAKHFQIHGNRLRHGGSAVMFECKYADLADWMSTLPVRTKMDPANSDAGNPCTNGYNCWPTNAQTWVPGNREFDGFTNTWTGATHPVVMLSCDSPTGDWLHVEIWRKSLDGNAVVKIYTDWN
jgi:hypothetical protein